MLELGSMVLEIGFPDGLRSGIRLGPSGFKKMEKSLDCELELGRLGFL